MEQINALAGYGSLAYHHMFQPIVPFTLSSGNGAIPCCQQHNLYNMHCPLQLPLVHVP
jgi:hypothetical protein